jgi:hypothetical protein
MNIYCIRTEYQGGTVSGTYSARPRFTHRIRHFTSSTDQNHSTPSPSGMFHELQYSTSHLWNLDVALIHTRCTPPPSH